MDDVGDHQRRRRRAGTRIAANHAAKQQVRRAARRAMVAAGQPGRAIARGGHPARARAACPRRRAGGTGRAVVGSSGLVAHRRTAARRHGDHRRHPRPVRGRGRHGASPAGRPRAARRATAVGVARKRIARQLLPLREGTRNAARRNATGGGDMREAVRVERTGPVTTVVLNRPEARNAVNGPTAAALVAAFEEFDNDDTTSVAVLWGDNGTFCAGADLKAFGTPDANAVHRTGPGPMGPTRMVLSKPVIAAVSGHAVAGGLELALWCDLRVAEEDAVFGVFCRRWGVPLIDGGTVRLPQVVGLGRALDLILTGRPVPAAEALQMGLVNRVVRPGAARDAAEQLALQIAAFPAACMRSDRASALESMSLGFGDAMANEFARGMATLADPGVVEGVSRFRGGAGRGGAPT